MTNIENTITSKDNSPKHFKTTITKNSPSSKPAKGSLSIMGPGGVRLANFKRKKQSLMKSFKSKFNVDSSRSPEEVEERYGNFRVIKPTQ